MNLKIQAAIGGVLLAAFGAMFAQAQSAPATQPAAALSPTAPALAGEPFIHDPSNVVESNGKYFTFGTGGGGLMSDDGWTWRGGAQRPGGGLAPDALKVGDKYFVAYASKGGGMNGGHAGEITVMWTKSLDPQSPDFAFQGQTVAASTNGTDEDADAIDPSLMLDPTTGKLWLTYGTYFGYIQVVELDPATGKRVEGNQPVKIAIDCEATDLIYRDGWYYLLGTHGTCCSGANSSYNIRVGRSKSVTGPYLDNNGMDMNKGGGKLFADASGRFVGPGHFGRMILGDGVERWSCHYEADLDRSGRSVLDIRPLMWKDGWPVAGDNFWGGTFKIESVRSGDALEISVDGVPMAGRAPRGGGGGGPGGGGFGGGGGGGGGPRPPGAGGQGGAPASRPAQQPNARIEVPAVTAVNQNWPAGNIDVRIGEFMLQPHQKWTVTPVLDKGGYPGSPYFKIAIEGTDRYLASTPDKELVAVPNYTGDDAQLWRIEQLIDGTYRVMPKTIGGQPNSDYVLTAIGASSASLVKYDFKNDKSKWTFRKP